MLEERGQQREKQWHADTFGCFCKIYNSQQATSMFHCDQVFWFRGKQRKISDNVPFPAHSLWKCIHIGGFKIVTDMDNFQRECVRKEQIIRYFFRVYLRKKTCWSSHIWNTEVPNENSRKFNVPQFFVVLSPVFPHRPHVELSVQKTHAFHTLYNGPNRGEITLHYLYINVVF